MGGGSKVVNNIYQSFVEDGPDTAFIITSEYPVTSPVVIYDDSGIVLTGLRIGETQSSNKYYFSVDTTSTYISPTEDDTYIYNLVKD